jgi:hypothetical protein
MPSLPGSLWPEVLFGGLGLQPLLQLFRKHVAGFEIRQQNNVRLPDHGRYQMLHAHYLRADSRIEGERTIKDGAGDLTAVCLLQSAAASTVDVPSTRVAALPETGSKSLPAETVRHA